jgi:pimeloyl-ACP methyl ester carboxylesterase
MKTEERRTFVLLAGGGMGAWLWSRLIPLLTCPAIAVDKRCESSREKATIDECAAYTAQLINVAGAREVVLVAHSGAGVIAPMVRRHTDAVKHIVFISANIPVDGRAPQQGLPLPIRIANYIAVKTGTKPRPARSLEKIIRSRFCNACSEDVIRYVLDQEIRPEPQCLVLEKVHRSGIPRVPGTYIKMLQDRTISVEGMDGMISNYGGMESVELEGDHMAMLGRPRELAEILNGIARGK